MNKEYVSIVGVIAFDVNSKKYCFLDYLDATDFTDGVYRSDYAYYVLVAEHELVAEIPAGFDTVKPQLDHLDHQEREVTARYHQAINSIQVQRNNLLAIENGGAA